MAVPASLGDLSLWREGLLVLILAVVLYMVFLLWRMRRISRRNELHAIFPVEPRVGGILDNLGVELTDDPPVNFGAAGSKGAQENTGNIPEWSEDSGVAFAQDAFMEGVERELEQLREEVDALRGALAALRGEVGGLRDAFEQESLSVRTAQNASPLYSDAMQMALLGHDPLIIAERCGISRAEAELVVALVKNKDS